MAKMIPAKTNLFERRKYGAEKDRGKGVKEPFPRSVTLVFLNGKALLTLPPIGGRRYPVFLTKETSKIIL